MNNIKSHTISPRRIFNESDRNDIKNTIGYDTP